MTLGKYWGESKVNDLHHSLLPSSHFKRSIDTAEFIFNGIHFLILQSKTYRGVVTTKRFPGSTKIWGQFSLQVLQIWICMDLWERNEIGVQRRMESWTYQKIGASKMNCVNTYEPTIGSLKSAHTHFLAVWICWAQTHTDSSGSIHHWKGRVKMFDLLLPLSEQMLRHWQLLTIRWIAGDICWF